MASKARNIADLLNASGKVTADDLDVGQIGGRRNLIINGGFDVWQRGTSFTSVGYTSDRWYAYDVTSISRSTDKPNSLTKYSLSMTLSTFGNAILQKIEDGEYLADGNTITFSAWVKGPAGKTAALSIGWMTEAAPYTFTGDWQYITRTVTFPSNYSSSASGTGHLHVHYVRATGGSTIAGGDTVLLTQCQAELGSVATPFEHRSYGEELALCQRYFYGVNENTAVGTNTFGFTTWYYNSTSARSNIQFPVTMRATPSFTASANTAFRIYRNNSNETPSGANMSIDNANADFITIAISSVSSTQGSVGGLQVRHGDGGYLLFDAEL